MENTLPQNDKSFFGHPRGLSTLFFTEMWERFSFYGLRALLMLYMTTEAAKGGLGWDNKKAAPIYALYAASVYFLPLIGGWLADRFIGAKRATLIGGIIIMIGHFTLAFSNPTTFYLGLIFVATGTGFLKSNISVMVGDLYTKEDSRRDAGFSIFYMGINLGATIAPLICGFLAENKNFQQFISSMGFNPHSSWHFGFAAAGVGMFFGLLQYLLGRKNLKNIGEVPKDDRVDAAGENAPGNGMSTLYIIEMIALVVIATTIIVLSVFVRDFDFALSYVLMPTVLIAGLIGVLLSGMQDKLDAGDWKRIGVIIILFVFSTIFWMGFEQAATSLNLFARDMTDLTVFGGWLEASSLQAVNGFFIVILAPVVGAVWYYLGTRQPSDAVKFSIALLFAGLGFVVVAAAVSMAGGGKVNPSWLFLVYFLHTIGELCLSPVGLSSMTKLAPPKMVSLMMGVWFLSISMGNYFAGMIAGEFKPEASVVISIFSTVAIILIAAAVLLFIISPLIKKLYAKPQSVVPMETA
ncbi:MAG TPA: peptide MFS transporter [Pyrinomonadaceae bacterium]|jgi:POT family proton-dependent oligopeptide transporter|nr:peptide MFS transporter [Pyrinomonadaceae bacterium]